MATITISNVELDDHLALHQELRKISIRSSDGLVFGWEKNDELSSVVLSNYVFHDELVVERDDLVSRDQLITMQSDLTRLEGELAKREDQILQLVKDKADLQMALGKATPKKKWYDFGSKRAIK